ncbi:MAG: aldehyde dehydrogenase family protein [Paraburkholderia sp.]|uniref:aldehyde dehydrogenase (NAD(+)) n=1 Tax=Paraburkholderia terricola TaxID=169427 RepID=A0A1M6T0Y6_9BURK|nr:MULTISPECIES: aldehyde dehydrogenase family protein [Paraburkholderia]TAL95183.1 MAG: aldehyde dehydrogenase family protein [Paraburkholderia sp.]SDO71247.1 aldehyde dehydrogenase (NAD+) [Paraburkholderia sediminicola]SHK50577.1 aldehyde dehydrogenase (NAD+) [Paraburkholderia terricola]
MLDQSNLKNFYIDGRWVSPVSLATTDVVNPATEGVIGKVAMGEAADVNAAVAAARRAFERFSMSEKSFRIELLNRILRAYAARAEDMAQAISLEMGAPITMARNAQVQAGIGHLQATIEALKNIDLVSMQGRAAIVREPVGVAALITPWNWPMNQIVSKLAPALAMGNTVVLKPSEVAPLSAMVFAEVMAAADLPRGVFNMINGDGPSVGEVLSGHSEVDVVSLTGSTRAGVAVSMAAAPTVKRVLLELGGKSANIILPDAPFEAAVKRGVRSCFYNTGQSCSAPTRMLVPAERYDDAAAIARRVVHESIVGVPSDPQTFMGPLANRRQHKKVQQMIEVGLGDGAELVAGGVGRPEGLEQGFYVKPTVFGRVHPSMSIFREEIFGPVLSISTYRTEEEAVDMANDSVYGLAAYVQSADIDHARRIASQLRAGSVELNYPEWDVSLPFGGYKQSGNGREGGEFGLHDFSEVKVIAGYFAPD